MKTQLTFAAIFGAAMFLGAADTYNSLWQEAHALHKAHKIEAAEKFAAAQKLAKDNYQRYLCGNYRCAVFMDCKKYDEAIEAAKDALKYASAPDKNGISDQQSVIYWRMGLTYNYAGKGPESLEAYSKSAKLAPRNSWMFSNSSCSSGTRARMLKKYDEAANCFRACYECEKTSPDSRIEARALHGSMLLELKKPQEALKLMENAEAISPKLSDSSKARIWDVRGRAYYDLKKFDDAIKAFLELYKYTANNDSYRAFCCGQIANCCRIKKDLANAAKYAQLCIDCKKARWGRDVRFCNAIIAEYQKSLKK